MAKKMNKSQAIRDYLSQNPQSTNKEVMEGLGQKGVKVSYNQVYFVKMKGRKAKRKAAVKATRAAGMSNPVEAVMKVRVLASQVGGMKSLKQLVDLLAE
jgi:arginine repressor